MDPHALSEPTVAFPFGKVLVTGGAGFIGSRVCEQLLARSVEVVALDNLSVGLPLPQARDHLVPIEGDIRDSALLDRIFATHRPDVVLHLAAVHHIPTCEREPRLACDVNVVGTQSVLDALEKSACRGIVMASSGAVYAWQDGPLLEDVSLLGATDVYSTTKLSNEYQLKAWSARRDRPSRVGRLFNTIGPNDPNGHLIPDILDQMTAGTGDAVVRLGNVKPRRDYVFVEDAAAAFIALLAGLEGGKPFDAYNISRGEEFAVSDIVASMGRLLGIEVSIESDPSRFRKIDRLSQLGDTAKMTNEIGWRAAVDLELALSRIVADKGFALAAAYHPSA